MKSYNKPTPEQFAAAMSSIASPEHELYFFNHLENPEWMLPLKTARFFANVPALEMLPEGGSRWTNWPAGGYLARMAMHEPELVCEIFQGIKTDNPAVHIHLLNAASKMSPSLAAKLVPSVIAAVKQSQWAPIFKDANALCARLAIGGLPDEAMKLAEALFTPSLDNDHQRASRDEYWYLESLKTTSPVLLAQRPKDFLKKLCSWLNIAILMKEPDWHCARSDIWRPAIEEHEQNRTYSFRSQVLGIVRTAFESAIRDSRLTVGQCIDILSHQRGDIFRRLQLHLLVEFGAQAPERVRNFILRKRLFNRSQYIHEYSRLLSTHYARLDPKDQATWIAWIAEGPAVQYRENADIRIKYWQFRRLHWIAANLEGNWKQFYDQMLAERGPPTLSDLNARIVTKWGRESPVTVAQLRDIGDFVSIVDFTVNWQPTVVQIGGPDREGLMSTFGELISLDPAEYSKLAIALIGKPPLVVHAFITQMEAAVRKGVVLDLEKILDLCKWVVSRPVHERAELDEPMDAFRNPDWQWTRETICSLIQRVCDMAIQAHSSPQYSNAYSDMVSLLENLAQDSSKSNLFKNTPMNPLIEDFATFAINSPRGKAIEAILSLMHWFADLKKTIETDNVVIPGGLDSMTEVKNILAWHIKRENASMVASAVIGMRLGVINWVDKSWLRTNVDELFDLTFDEEHPERAFGWAAWNAFLVWVQPHFEFYELLRRQFAVAIKQASRANPKGGAQEQPMFRLGDHLMVLYGRGQLSMDADNGVLTEFLTSASFEIRAHTLGFVGQSISGPEPLPGDVIERFVKLWEWYWPNVGKPNVDPARDRYSFGQWFASGQFPASWAIRQLLDFVRVVGVPEPDHAVFGQLAKVAESEPESAVEIVFRFERADALGDSWHIHSCLDEVKSILRTALKAGGNASKMAEVVLDNLARRGFIELGELLQGH